MCKDEAVGAAEPGRLQGCLTPAGKTVRRVVGAVPAARPQNARQPAAGTCCALGTVRCLLPKAARSHTLVPKGQVQLVQVRRWGRVGGWTDLGSAQPHSRSDGWLSFQWFEVGGAG